VRPPDLLREDGTVTPARPARRPTGYSGTPLHRKLGVRPGHRVLVVGAPAAFPLDLLGADGAADVVGAAARPAEGPPAEQLPTEGPPAEVVLAFCPDAATLGAVLAPALAATAEPGGRCWIAWPKRASGVPTDLTEDVVRAAALAAGWVDVKVCAVDAVWSGLCLMRRTRSAVVDPGRAGQ
jgi:hypothetical protein